jgi:hypothetical protein
LGLATKVEEEGVYVLSVAVEVGMVVESVKILVEMEMWVSLVEMVQSMGHQEGEVQEQRDKWEVHEEWPHHQGIVQVSVEEPVYWMAWR